MNEKLKCGNCQWWHKQYTECRAESPRVFPIPHDPYESVSHFPKIAEGEWCAKWAPVNNVWGEGANPFVEFEMEVREAMP
jgi:hypothetical protein